MTEEFVTVKGTEYYVDTNGKLNLRKKEITDISEIKGLETLTTIQTLDLYGNQIAEIKGLENLTKLWMLELKDNPIEENERYLRNKNVQDVVKYCQEKARKAKEGNGE
ncbi:MAG: hypothetical protein ACFFCD_06150 [Promethearchaeota archaeon]